MAITVTAFRSLENRTCYWFFTCSKSSSFGFIKPIFCICKTRWKISFCLISFIMDIPRTIIFRMIVRLLFFYRSWIFINLCYLTSELFSNTILKSNNIQITYYCGGVLKSGLRGQHCVVGRSFLLALVQILLPPFTKSIRKNIIDLTNIANIYAPNPSLLQ